MQTFQQDVILNDSDLNYMYGTNFLNILYIFLLIFDLKMADLHHLGMQLINSNWWRNYNKGCANAIFPSHATLLEHIQHK